MRPPYPLISDIAQGRCLPFIGAGFSKNAVLPPGLSMPDWTELTLILAKDAATTSGEHPTVVAQRYEQRFGRVQLIERIRETLHLEKSAPGSAHRAFAGLPFDTVYTTNFDLLLESAYSSAGRPFRSLVGELQLPFHAGQIASSIIKMHGDMRHEEYIVITKNDYDCFMEKYPVIATHLSAMLITRTPLFLGYSRSDPDFDNIRKVVRDRLGAFERMAYVVQFDAPDDWVEKALEEKLHIISLSSSSGKTRDIALTSFFKEIQAELDTKGAINLRTSRPDLFEEIETERVQNVLMTPQDTSVLETTSRLCFVMMPFNERSDQIYRLVIAPAAEENGLTVLRADEMTAAGNIIEQIRAAIQQSRLLIADITNSNPNVLYEAGFAQAMGKPVILLGEKGSILPFDITQQRIVMYGDDFDAAKTVLRTAIFVALSGERLKKATTLFDQGLYRASIAAAAVVLEHTLRHNLVISPTPGRPLSLGALVRSAQEQKLVDRNLLMRLDKTVKLRNRAVHDLIEPTKQDAQTVLSTIRELVETLPSPETKELTP